MLIKVVGSFLSLFLIGSSNYMLVNLMLSGSIEPLSAISNYIVAGISFLMGLTILLILYLTGSSWRRDLFLTATFLLASAFELAPLLYIGIENPNILISWAPQTALNILFGIGFMYMAVKKARSIPVEVEIAN